MTVVDQTRAVIPNATVTVRGIEDATKSAAVGPAQTTGQGLATFGGLAPGRYEVRAEFPGFQPGRLADVRVRAGDNRHIIVLALQRVEQEVTVARDPQAAAAERNTLAFGSALTREQIDALSDDPEEMRRQLLEMAGGDALIRVDSFEGARAADEVADQVDPHHARPVRGREPQRRRPVHRHHHAARARRDPRRGQLAGFATAR